MINVELVQSGSTVQPIAPVEICLEVTSREEACLSFFNENTQEWECEDPCLQYEGNLACGTTTHFTNFAILLSGGSGSGAQCGDSENDWILNSGWQDGILISSLCACCFCGVILVMIIGTIFPKLHGEEHKRIDIIRNVDLEDVHTATHQL